RSPTSVWSSSAFRVRDRRDVWHRPPAVRSWRQPLLLATAGSMHRVRCAECRGNWWMTGDVKGSISWAGSWGWHRHDTTSQRPFRTVEMVAARDRLGRSGRSGRTRPVDNRRGLLRTPARPGMKWHGTSKRFEPMPTAAGFNAACVIAAPANTAKNPVHQVSPSPSEGHYGHRPPNGSYPMNVTLPSTE